MMKFHEAMRKGAALHPQVYKKMADSTDNNEMGTCAIGATYEGLFGSLPPEDVSDDTIKWAVGDTLFPNKDWENFLVGHPLSTNEAAEFNLLGVVFQLNDQVQWTREQIADWLESIGY